MVINMGTGMVVGEEAVVEDFEVKEVAIEEDMGIHGTP